MWKFVIDPSTDLAEGEILSEDLNRQACFKTFFGDKARFPAEREKASFSALASLSVLIRFREYHIMTVLKAWSAH
jgi:hypothetical protein